MGRGEERGEGKGRVRGRRREGRGERGNALSVVPSEQCLMSLKALVFFPWEMLP